LGRQTLRHPPNAWRAFLFAAARGVHHGFMSSKSEPIKTLCAALKRSMAN
jgi:hypothetical protein